MIAVNDGGIFQLRYLCLLKSQTFKAVAPGEQIGTGKSFDIDDLYLAVMSTAKRSFSCV